MTLEEINTIEKTLTRLEKSSIPKASAIAGILIMEKEIHDIEKKIDMAGIFEENAMFSRSFDAKTVIVLMLGLPPETTSLEELNSDADDVYCYDALWEYIDDFCTGKASLENTVEYILGYVGAIK